MVRFYNFSFDHLAQMLIDKIPMWTDRNTPYIWWACNCLRRGLVLPRSLYGKRIMSMPWCTWAVIVIFNLFFFRWKTRSVLHRANHHVSTSLASGFDRWYFRPWTIVHNMCKSHFINEDSIIGRGEYGVFCVRKRAHYVLRLSIQTQRWLIKSWLLEVPHCSAINHWRRIASASVSIDALARIHYILLGHYNAHFL